MYRVLDVAQVAGFTLPGVAPAAAPPRGRARHRAADRRVRRPIAPARRGADGARRLPRDPLRDDPDGGHARRGSTPWPVAVTTVGRGLGDRVRRGRHRRLGARDDDDPHHASRERMGLRARHPRQRGVRRDSRPRGHGNPAAGTARFAQPARGAHRRRRAT